MHVTFTSGKLGEVGTGVSQAPEGPTKRWLFANCRKVIDGRTGLDSGSLLPRYSGGEGLGMRGLGRAKYGKTRVNRCAALPLTPAPLPGVPGRGEPD